MNVIDWKDSKMRVVSAIKIWLADKMMYHVMDEESQVAIWLKLESSYMSKSNKLLLKKKLYGLKMAERSTQTYQADIENLFYPIKTFLGFFSFFYCVPFHGMWLLCLLVFLHARMLLKRRTREIKDREF